MQIIARALENLEQQYPKKSPKKILRNMNRALRKPLRERSRADRKYLLSFAIAIFEVLLPDTILDAISKAVEPKIRKRLLTVRMLLLSLIVYHLSPEIKSYPDLIRELTLRLKHKLPKGVDRLLAKSSFSYQLARRSPRIFRTILIYLLNLILEHSSPELIKGRYEVKAMDYSVFDLPPALEPSFQTASNQAGKAQVQCRMHTVFDANRKLVEAISLTSCRTNEKRRFKALFDLFPSRPSTIWVCDLGYWAFGIMDLIIARGSHFVFRLREKTAFTIIQVLNAENQDYWVRLGSLKSHKSLEMDHLVRLVACPQEGSEIYYYVTSLTDPSEFTAQDIRAIYKLRWSVEIFFRHFKHVIDFQPACQNPNGIEIEFLSALITYSFVQMIIMDVSQQYGIPSEDISFVETYRTVNSWIRKSQHIFSEAPIEEVRKEYEKLLAFIAQNCLAETTKKRLAQERKLFQQQPYSRAA